MPINWLEGLIVGAVALAFIVVLCFAAWPRVPANHPVEWREQTGPLDPADLPWLPDEVTSLLTPDNRFNGST